MRAPADFNLRSLSLSHSFYLSSGGASAYSGLSSRLHIAYKSRARSSPRGIPGGRPEEAGPRCVYLRINVPNRGPGYTGFTFFLFFLFRCCVEVGGEDGFSGRCFVEKAFQFVCRGCASFAYTLAGSNDYHRFLLVKVFFFPFPLAVSLIDKFLIIIEAVIKHAWYILLCAYNFYRMNF